MSENFVNKILSRGKNKRCCHIKEELFSVSKDRLFLPQNPLILNLINLSLSVWQYPPFLSLKCTLVILRLMYSFKIHLSKF